MTKEIWKDIKGYEGLYQVSNLGRVSSCCRLVKNRFSEREVSERIIKPVANSTGTVMVKLCKESDFQMKALGKLVAEAFVENPHNLPIVKFQDGDKTNCVAENLSWTRRKVKLTKKKVLEISAMIEEGVSTGEIVKKYNITRMTVKRIRDRTTWKDILKWDLS